MYVCREEEKTSEQRRGSYFSPLNMSILLKLLIASSTEVSFQVVYSLVFVTQNNGNKVNIKPPYCTLLPSTQSEGPLSSYQYHIQDG